MAVGRYRPTAPTDPYVPTLEHTVPRPTGSPSAMVPVAIRSSDGDMLTEPQCARHVSLDRICRPTLRFPPQGPPGRVPLLQRYYQSATTSCRPSRRTSFPSLGGTSVALARFAPRRTSAPSRPGVGNPVSPAGKLTRKRQELPSSWGTPIVRLHMIQSDSGRTARTRPLRCSSVALGTTKAKAPTKGLSKLNSMAFGLAVYASPGSLPHHDARLTSGCWSGATGRAFHPQGSYERFQICKLHLIPLSQALLGAMLSTEGRNGLAHVGTITPISRTQSDDRSWHAPGRSGGVLNSGKTSMLRGRTY